MSSTQLEKLKSFYADYASADLADLHAIYADEVEFTDPLHRVVGVSKLHDYFERGRKGLTECKFDFKSQVEQGSHVVMEWQMTFGHARLKRGIFRLDGCSVLVFCPERGQVVKHTDYFDVGAMVYENTPVLGRVIKLVKSQAGGAN